MTLWLMISLFLSQPILKHDYRIYATEIYFWRANNNNNNNNE